MQQCPVCGTPTYGEYQPGGNLEGEQPTGGYGYSYNNPGRYYDPGVNPGDRRGLAIASLVLGLVALLGCCVPFVVFPAGAAALVMGVMSVKSSAKGFAVAGIVLGVIALLLGAAYLVMSLIIMTNIDFDAIMNDMNMYY